MLPRGISLYINENEEGRPQPHLHMYCPEGVIRIFFSGPQVDPKSQHPQKADKYIRLVLEWMKPRMDQLYREWANASLGLSVNYID